MILYECVTADQRNTIAYRQFATEKMEKNSIEKPLVYNGNVNHDEFYPDDSNSDKSQETSISDTLVFYVNGKEVRW